MIGFSVGGCLDCIHFLLVATLALVFLFGAALIVLSVIRIINATVSDADERAAGRAEAGCDLGWDLMVDDIQWRRAVARRAKPGGGARPGHAGGGFRPR